MVEPDVVELDASRGHAERWASWRWNPIATLHSPMAR